MAVEASLQVYPHPGLNKYERQKDTELIWNVGVKGIFAN